MDKKLPYEEPELLYYIFDLDVITASGNNDIEEDEGENDGEWM